MENQFFVEVRVNLRFTDQEFQLLNIGFSRHYDFDIKQAASIGGWFYGYATSRRLDENPHDAPLMVCSRRLDYMLKALEVVEPNEAGELIVGLRDVWVQLNQKRDLMNQNLQVS